MEKKYWITPEGKTINISAEQIDEHFKYFNDSELGISLKKKYSFNKVLTPKDLSLIVNKGFIRVLLIGDDTLNISYAGHSLANYIPVSSSARNELLVFIHSCHGIKFVQYDVFIGADTFSGIVTLREYLKLFENVINIDRELLKKIIKDI